MQPLSQLRSLDLLEPSSPGRPLHLAAASGLVQVGDFLYVVADDELHLGIFSRTSGRPGQLLRLFEGELPDEPKERKSAKPDLEALLVLPAFAGFPQGALLALGSGSKRKRRQGIVLGLDANGTPDGVVLRVDLSELYAELKQTFDDLNIEGAFVIGDTINLLQRGNKSADSQNALIRLQLEPVLEAIVQGQPLPANAVLDIVGYDLGTVGDVPLCFTDAAALPDGTWVFSAAAEATDNSYADGELAGAALGIADSRGKVLQLLPLDAGYKIEGVAAQVEDGTLHLLLVTDADNPEQAASLLAYPWQGYPFTVL